MRSEWLLPRALRLATPLLVAHGLLVLVGMAWKPALLFVLADPRELAQFIVLDETLGTLAAIALLGLPTAVLRLTPEHPSERASITATALLLTVTSALLVYAVVAWLPGVADLVFGDAVAARGFRWYGLRLPTLGAIALLLAMIHAAGRLRRKGILQVGERLTFVVPALGAAWMAGVDGLVVGAVVGGAAAAAVVASGCLPTISQVSWRPRTRWVRPLLSVGGLQAGVMLFETARTVAVLRVMTALDRSDGEVAGLGAALALLLPTIAGPELIAQALFPRMIGPDGVAADTGRRHSRLLGELSAVFLPLLTLYGLVVAWVLAVARDGALSAGAIPALLLVPGVAAHGLVAQTGYVLLVRDRLPRMVLISGLSLLCTTALAIWLVPLLGAAGAAAALSTGLVLRGILFVVAARGDGEGESQA